MKKLISLIVFTWVAISLVAQCDLPYKPLSEFNKDTTAFILYNFADRAGQYKGKAYEDVYQNLQIPMQYITGSTTNSNIERLYIYLFDDSASHSIYICWEKENPNIKDLQNESKIYQKYKKYKVRDIGVILSSDYKNYKQTKNKSDKPRGYIRNGLHVYSSK
ncbi:MAG: hypothetical protein ACK5M3_18300 [Dysgonomonas sp.]